VERGAVTPDDATRTIEKMPARLIAVCLVALATACGSEATVVTDADYLAELEAICGDTTATIDALPRPPEQISVTDFATSAAGALDNEAERARALQVPGDLSADHRAFVLNTDEQVAAWRAIATGGQDSVQLGELTVRVGELIRGRNDLVDEMGAPGCRRGEV
jgi:hypothetical protein